ncbi:MAG: hypothetical protein HY767_04020, partial [Candidatus Omnitrophica bacterium]|nr:hypothetical protein [Candidatus Omnitrophota bacterium]
APATLQAGWGWGDQKKEEKKAHQMEQKQENKEFRQALKEKTPEEKEAAIQKHRETQLAENKAFQQALHDQQMAEFKAKLEKNTKLTEAQKAEILATREKQYAEMMVHGDQRRSENAAFFQTLSDNPNMTEQQKREAIRAHFQSQKPANQAFRQQQKADSQAEREKIRSEVASSTDTVAT